MSVEHAEAGRRSARGAGDPASGRQALGVSGVGGQPTVFGARAAEAGRCTVQGLMMTAEQRWILDLGEVLAIRVDCARCSTSVSFKPIDWRDAPTACPSCGGLW